MFTNILLTFVIFILEKRPAFSVLGTTQEESIFCPSIWYLLRQKIDLMHLEVLLEFTVF